MEAATRIIWFLEDRPAARMGPCGPTNATPFAIAQNTTLLGGPKFLFFATLSQEALCSPRFGSGGGNGMDSCPKWLG